MDSSELNTPPKGIPSITYLRVLPGNNTTSTDIGIDGNAITISEPSQPLSRYEVAQVLERRVTDDEFCDSTIGNKAGLGLGASLNPISAFVHDAATTLLLFVGSKQTKKWRFLKKNFLPFLADEVFSFIVDHEHQHILKTGSTDFYQKYLSLTAFEIQDEVICDLLRPESKGLSVSMSPDEGHIIRGAFQKPIYDLDSLKKALVDSAENRVSTSIQPVGGSIDTSAAVWELTLYQKEIHPNMGMTRCKSRLIIVDIPSVDGLIEGNMSLRQLQAISLYKSLATFLDVSRKLSMPGKANIAPFTSSVLTNYLSEYMGGNAIVVGMGMIAPGEPTMSKLTLEVMQYLTRSVHFPVSGREITDILQGLLCKYRSLILQLQSGTNGDNSLMKDEESEMIIKSNERRIIDLQREVAQLLLEKNTAVDDRNKIYDVLELLKTKYNTVLNEKIAQNEELMKSEEEKICLARALVELKLEYSQLKESSEDSNYDLTKKLLEANGRISELEKRSESLRVDGTNIKDMNSRLQAQLQEEKEGHASTKAALKEVRDQLKKENDRVIELGAEILTLYNHKEVLQRKCNDQQNSLDSSTLNIQSLNSQKEKLDSDYRLTKSELEDRDQLVKSLRNQLANSEIEIKKLSLEIEHLQQDTERMISDFNREKEGLFKEFQREKQLLEESLTGGLKANDKSKMSLSDIQLKKYEKQNKELQTQLLRAQEDFKLASTVKEDLDRELTSLRGEYRRKLAEYLIDGPPSKATAASSFGSPVIASTNSNSNSNSSSNGNIGNNDPNSDGSSELFKSIRKNDMQIKEEAVLQSLVGSYVGNEKRLITLSENLLAQNSFLRQTLRHVIDNYNTLLNFNIDGMSNNEGLKEKLEWFSSQEKFINEEIIIGNEAINQADSVCRNSEATESELLRRQVKSSHNDFVMEQERLRIVIENYKKHLNEAETKLAQSKTEITELSMQLARFLNKDAIAGKEFVTKTENQKQIQSLQNELTDKFKHLMDNNNASKGADTKSGMSYKRLLQSSSPVDGEILAYIQALEKNANEGVLKQLSMTEEKMIEIQNRNIGLQEELKAYQNYMKENILQYKKQILFLQQKIKQLISNGNNLGTPSKMGLPEQGQDDMKLPSISKS